MRVEDEYLDVLQNIEHMIVETYTRYPEMSDYDVMRALEALTDVYSAEKIGRPPRDFRLSDTERHVEDAMRQACEWRLGRGSAPAPLPAGSPTTGPEPLTPDEIILCLKRLLKSAQKWNKEGGRQGYLDFILQYVP